MIEKVGDGVNVEGPRHRDRHEGPEDEDEVEPVLREREQGNTLNKEKKNYSCNNMIQCRKV